MNIRCQNASDDVFQIYARLLPVKKLLLKENEMLKDIVNRDVGDAYMDVSEDEEEFEIHMMIKMKMLILNSLYQIILLSRMNFVYVIIEMRMVYVYLIILE
ncbi:hypothetical protein Tco_0169376 [Tanacetum coccineum]